MERFLKRPASAVQPASVHVGEHASRMESAEHAERPVVHLKTFGDVLRWLDTQCPSEGRLQLVTKYHYQNALQSSNGRCWKKRRRLHSQSAQIGSGASGIAERH